VENARDAWKHESIGQRRAKFRKCLSDRGARPEGALDHQEPGEKMIKNMRFWAG
jgi:hypothetical protein